MLTKIERICLYSSLAVLLIVAIFFDLQISEALYAPTNLFGQIFEVSSEIPAYLIGVFAAACIFRFLPSSSKKWLSVVLKIAFGGATLFIAWKGGEHFLKLLNRVTLRTGTYAFPFYFSFVYGLCYLALGVPAAFLVKGEYKKEAFAFGVCYAVFFLSLLGTMQGLKSIWLRPRYRTLVALFGKENASSYWLPFYKINGFWNFSAYSIDALGQSSVSNAMARLGIESWTAEEFYSFPSGHTMNFVGCMAICLSSSFFTKLKGKEWIVRVCFYALGIAVAVSRIVRGAHNLSDVTVGFFLAVLAYDLMSKFLFPWIDKLVKVESPSFKKEAC